MKTVLQKWGNSLALRIPKTFADEIKVEEGEPVTLSVIKGRLVISPATAPEFRLEELVAQITRKNMHSAMDTGAAQGGEVW